MCGAFQSRWVYIEHSACLDLVDYSPITSGDYFEKALAFIRNISATDSVGAGRVFASMQRARTSFDFFPDQPVTTGISQDFPVRATVDEYIQQDMFETTGTYDFIYTFAVFDLLDLDKALAKVRELISNDGLFVCLDEYWWFPINSSAIIGHFPYTMQRLSFSDLERYVSKHHPAILPNLRNRYYFLYGGTPPPTINDWFKIAKRQGLRPVAVERIIPKTHARILDSPPQLLTKPWFDSDEVLRDIHHLKPDVMLDDLLTSSIYIAMVAA